MGRIKGKAMDETQEKNLVPLNQRSPEERKEIAKKSVESRKRKRNEKMALQLCLRNLLDMKTHSTKAKNLLKAMGYKDSELTNQVLLMVSLFKKGINGDVQAIKEIVSMMDKLDLYKQTGRISTEVNIQLVSVGEVKDLTEEELKEIEEVQKESGV